MKSQHVSPKLVLVALFFAASSGSVALAQHVIRKPEIPEPGKGYNWRTAAKENGLNEKMISQLARDKVILTREQFVQVFTPCLAGPLPFFESKKGTSLIFTSETAIVTDAASQLPTISLTKC
jgi:hypothetical protein